MYRLDKLLHVVGSPSQLPRQVGVQATQQYFYTTRSFLSSFILGRSLLLNVSTAKHETAARAIAVIEAKIHCRTTQSKPASALLRNHDPGDVCLAYSQGDLTDNYIAISLVEVLLARMGRLQNRETQTQKGRH